LTGGLRAWASRLKRDLVAVSHAARDPRTPLAVRILALGLLAYVLSPIDLIPDFIPVLGLVDELILVPIGLWVLIRLIPPAVMAEHRRNADRAEQLPRSGVGAVAVVSLWVIAGLALLAWLA
jgi:uncharacterized membrane protein YkvA (DUF1232 family)